MTLTYRGIKHTIVSSARPSKPGNLPETYRGVVLRNRVATVR